MYSLYFYKAGQWDTDKIMSAYSAMPKSRKQRVDQITTNQVYKEFLIVEYQILKTVLNISATQDFSYTSLGKPFILGKPNFSISHSQDFLVIAVSNNDIGVDVQKVEKYNPSLAKKVLSLSELKLVENSKNKAYQFAKLWTKKEAKTKLLGGSVFDDTKNILNDSQNYKFWVSRKNGFVITICEKDL